VQIDAVEYYAIQDPMTELNRYLAGELDITATVPGANIDKLKSTREGELHVAPKLGIYYLAFDLSEGPLDDLALRQAMTMAIDRDSLVAIIGRGEQPAYGLIPDGVSGYAPTRYGWSGLTDTQRQAEARRIFASSDFSHAAPPQIRLTYDVGDIHEKVALAVSSMWREVLGIDVELDKREWKYFLATRENREEWQIMRFAWTGDYDHASTFTGILHSESPQNLPGYNSPRFDELIDAAVTAKNPDAQAQLFASAEAVMLEDYPIAPLYFYVSKHLVSPAVQGFHGNVLDQHPSRFLKINAQSPVHK
jgi:oligopeptide transport system substrate-binding protein